jgi:formate hydrogenlyase subunit 4
MRSGQPVSVALSDANGTTSSNFARLQAFQEAPCHLLHLPLILDQMICTTVAILMLKRKPRDIALGRVL